MFNFIALSRLSRKFFVAVLCCCIFSVAQADEEGFEDPEEAKQGESFSDSVSNIWNIVSDNVSKAAKVSADKVKDVSVDVGKKVSDTAVEAWDKSVDAYNEYTSDDTGDDSTARPLEDFGNEDTPAAAEKPEGKNNSAPPIPKKKTEEKNKEEKKTLNESSSGISRSISELWGSVSNSFTSVAEDQGSQGLWDKLNVDLDKIAQRIKKEETLPASAWVGEDRVSNREKINDMLKDVLEILEVSNVSERRNEYERLGNEILERNKDIILYREKMVTAPQKVSTVEKVWSNTVDDYKRKIADTENEIADYKQRQELLLAQIQQELKGRSGIDMSREQVYSLVVMVTGDSYIKLNSIFYNIKQLVAVLEELAQKNHDYISSVNKYYGMYSVLVEALKLAHTNEIDKIRNDYLPKIEKYRVKAELASEDTRKLIRKNSGNKNYLNMLEDNLKAQAEVKRAATEYGEYLQDYLINIEQSKRIIERQLDVVLDTWKTTQLASGLLAVMKSSSQGLKNLVSMKLPDIAPLDIGRLKEQFSTISMELRK